MIKFDRIEIRQLRTTGAFQVVLYVDPANVHVMDIHDDLSHVEKILDLAEALENGSYKPI